MDNICNVSCQYIAKTIKQKIINGMVWYFHLYSGLKYLAFSYFVPVKKFIKFIPIFFAKSFVWSINIFLQQILVYHYDNQTNNGIYGCTIFPFVLGVKVWRIFMSFFD